MKKNKPQKNIPNGWQQIRLGDICVFKKGKGLPKTDLVNNGKYEAIHYGELFTKYNEKINTILSSTNNNKNVFLSKKNDILMPTSDVTPKGLSTASFIDKDGVVLGGDILVIRPEAKKLSGLFFSNFVAAQKREIIKLVSGTTVFHLYASDMAKLRFNIPPLSEQKRIVAVLEVWDEMVEKLARKIEIKKNIKKGLMQELLSGKKRLIGFNKEWKVVKLGDMCDIGTGKKDVNQGNPNGKYPFFTCAKKYTHSDGYSFDMEAILIAGNGEVGHCQYYKGKFEAYQRTYILSNFKMLVGYLSPYLNYHFRSFVNNKKQMGAMPYIKIGMLEDFIIKMPLDAKEQKAIADILVTADREIEKLEEKLKIIKEQKKFLLNNLITGQIRVPASNE